MWYVLGPGLVFKFTLTKPHVFRLASRSLNLPVIVIFPHRLFTPSYFAKGLNLPQGEGVRDSLIHRKKNDTVYEENTTRLCQHVAG